MKGRGSLLHRNKRAEANQPNHFIETAFPGAIAKYLKDTAVKDTLQVSAMLLAKQIRQLDRLRRKKTALERTVAHALRSELASLSAAYGCTSVKDFVRMLRRASRPKP
jgi:hypothetical protein